MEIKPARSGKNRRAARHESAGPAPDQSLSPGARRPAGARVFSGLWLGSGLWLFGFGLPAAAAGDDPLSAIGWLSQSVMTPASPPSPGLTEPPVAEGGALPQEVSTTLLDLPSPDAVGLIAPGVSGLPKTLWGAGRTDEIARALLRDRMESLPALRQLFLTMLLAEADPPADHGARGRLLQARIDKLLLLGALEQAAALLQLNKAGHQDLFRRSFDIALLTGNEDRACGEMLRAPGLAPTVQAHVFCLARSGDWDTAALTLSTAEALGDVDKDQAIILGRFLDPELFEQDAMPAPPSPVTPLDWKLYEAVGETIPTNLLPIAFSYAELGPETGWKARIEAAERLTRAGTIAPNVLLGLYTERSPAASGGVWERVRAFQNFDAAFSSGETARIAATLPDAWARMQEAELEVPFAFLYGPKLSQLTLSGETARMAFRIGLLSPAFEEIARNHEARDGYEQFLRGLALGRIEQIRAPDSMGRAIGSAFMAPQISDEAQLLVRGNRLGEALLTAIEEIQRGVEGNSAGVSRGLSLLRQVGLEKVARRSALELMILERRG